MHKESMQPMTPNRSAEPIISPPNSKGLQEWAETIQSPTVTTDYDGFFTDVISGLKAEGRYRQFRRIERKRGELPMATADETPEVLNWCSNDYLCMGQTEEVVGAAEAAALQQSTGMARIPSQAQVKLENELALLHG